MQRIGACIGLKADQVERYLALHREVWPSVLATIADCNIKNYSIFLKRPENLLFAYYEYHGTDLQADLAKMAADPETQAWWAINDPLQEPFPTRAAGEWFAAMEPIFFTDGDGGQA